MGRRAVYDGSTKTIGAQLPTSNFDLALTIKGRKSWGEYVNELIEDDLKKKAQELEIDTVIEVFNSKNELGSEQIKKGPIFQIKKFLEGRRDLKSLTSIFPDLKYIFECAQSKINALQGREIMSKPQEITTLNPVEKLRVDSLEFHKNPLSQKAGMMEATLLSRQQEKSKKNTFLLDVQKRKLKIQNGLNPDESTEIMLYQPNEQQ